MTIHSSTHDENIVLLNTIFQSIYIIYTYILNLSFMLLIIIKLCCLLFITIDLFNCYLLNGCIIFLCVQM